MQQSLSIISRKSPLALCQAEIVKRQLNLLYPNISISITGVTTVGDEILDKSLSKVGGKGLFTKELEVALINGVADIAVHSTKDLPAELANEFTLAAILEREDAADAFVSNHYDSLEYMPSGSVIGTSSLRRSGILSKYYPQLQIKLLRGNIHTRLRKLDDGEYAGIILAVAGLNRLGLANRIKQRLNENIFIPSIGQGALAIETLKSNAQLNELIKPLTHLPTEITIKTEREVGRILNASCEVPIAVYATLQESTIYLQALITDGKDYYHAKSSGGMDDYLSVAVVCANELLHLGAGTILNRYKKCI